MSAPANDIAAVPTPLKKPELDYPCGDAPEPGRASEIVPGVLWLRMPMPLR